MFLYVLYVFLYVLYAFSGIPYGPRPIWAWAHQARARPLPQSTERHFRIHRATFQISLLCVFIVFYTFMGSLEKDARRKTMQVGVIKISSSLTATRLVTKRIMSVRPQKSSILEPCQPPNSSLTHPHAQHLIAIPAPRCGGLASQTKNVF